MPDISILFNWLLWGFASVGITITIVLAIIGFRMVYMAFTFAVQYSFAEYRAKKLKNASEFAKKEFGVGEDEDGEEPLEKPKKHSKKD